MKLLKNGLIDYDYYEGVDLEYPKHNYYTTFFIYDKGEVIFKSLSYDDFKKAVHEMIHQFEIIPKYNDVKNQLTRDLGMIYQEIFDKENFDKAIKDYKNNVGLRKKQFKADVFKETGLDKIDSIVSERLYSYVSEISEPSELLNSIDEILEIFKPILEGV